MHKLIQREGLLRLVKEVILYRTSVVKIGIKYKIPAFDSIKSR